MKQFKSLIKRDLYLNKWSLLLPVIIIAVSYLFIIMIDMRWGINLENISYKMHGSNIPFIGLVGVVFGNIWLSLAMIALVICMMAPNALNDNIKNNCEIFYKCLPIPPWKIIVSKLLICIIVPQLIVMLIAIFNVFIAYLFLGGSGEISLGSYINLTLSSLLFITPYNLLIGAFFMFLSSIMRKKVFVRFIGLLVGANIAIQILTTLSGLNIKTLSEYINIWLMNPSLTGSRIISLEKLTDSFMTKMTLDSGVREVSNMIGTSIFSWDGFCLLFSAIILLTASVYAYKYRKLD